jgi:hypothetical protein
MATGNPNDLGRNPDPMMNNSAWGCGWAWLWFWLFIIVIVFGAWGWGGWYGGWGGPRGWWAPRQAPPAAQAPQAPRQPSAPAPSGVFLGREVTVTGTVDHIYGPQTFTLAPAAGGHDLLVINKHEKKAPNVGETVKVTGKVEKYEESALHKQTGVELNKVPGKEFTGKPAVVASGVTVQASTARKGGES